MNKYKSLRFFPPVALLSCLALAIAFWGGLRQSERIAALLGLLMLAGGVAAVYLLQRLRRSAVRIDEQAAALEFAQQELEGLKQTQDTVRQVHERHLQDLQAKLRETQREREEFERQIRRSSRYDPMTQLPNREALRGTLEKALAAAKRGRHSVGVMFLDVDDFKRINGTLGHQGGDELLRQAAARLGLCVRREDEVAVNRSAEDGNVARVGGDEFVLVIREVADPAALAAVAKRAVDAFRASFQVGGQKVQVSVSAGVACFPRDGQDPDSLLKFADMAMHRTKQLGGDGFQFYSPQMGALAHQRLALENGLRKALECGQLVLHYQPKVDGRTRRIVGVEALVRWNCPENGLVLPGRFIPVAEETGLIAPLGDWVLMEACRQQRAWSDAGLASVPVAVNVSSMQFREDQVLSAVVAAITRSGIPPRLLQLEVTENLFLKNMDAAVNTLRYVRGIGVGVAIDDFGTGYSSFSYLRQLPLDAVKIDRSFVQNLGTHAGDREITRTIVGLAGVLGLKTVAEGVETEQQAEALLEMGCDELQGYRYGRPVDAATMTRLLALGTVPLERLEEVPAQIIGSAAPAPEIQFNPNATIVNTGWRLDAEDAPPPAPPAAPARIARRPAPAPAAFDPNATIVNTEWRLED